VESGARILIIDDINLILHWEEDNSEHNERERQNLNKVSLPNLYALQISNLEFNWNENRTGKRKMLIIFRAIFLANSNKVFFLYLNNIIHNKINYLNNWNLESQIVQNGSRKIDVLSDEFIYDYIYHLVVYYAKIIGPKLR
jgi:hypothetical protein